MNITHNRQKLEREVIKVIDHRRRRAARARDRVKQFGARERYVWWRNDQWMREQWRANGYDVPSFDH